jgi:hypothetical protein
VAFADIALAFDFDKLVVAVDVLVFETDFESQVVQQVYYVDRWVVLLYFINLETIYNFFSAFSIVKINNY